MAHQPKWTIHAAAALPAWKIQGKLCLQGKLKLLKNLKDKKYFNTVKNFWVNSVFQGKRRLFKILNDKIYILNTVNSGTLWFQGKHKLLKNPECKNYI